MSVSLGQCSLCQAIVDNDIDLFSILVTILDVKYTVAPLITAASLGRVDMATLLLDAGAPINAASGDDGRCACHVAIVFDRFPMFELLVARGANVNTFDVDANSPLSCALRSNRDDRYLLTLLDAGASIDYLSAEQKMELATRSVAVLSCLLRHDVDVGALRVKHGETFCHVVLSTRLANAMALLRTLVDHDRAVLDKTDYWRMTPFQCAIAQSNEDAFRILVELGVDVDSLHFHGDSALHRLCADWHSTTHCVTVLVALGADVQLLNREGQTSCHVAARREDRSQLCVLLAAGADFDQKDNSACTARDYAVRMHSPLPTAADIDAARRAIARARLDLVRWRALDICIGLQPLALDAVRLCEILAHSFGTLASLILLHQWWRIATTVKHFISIKHSDHY